MSQFHLSSAERRGGILLVAVIALAAAYKLHRMDVPQEDASTDTAALHAWAKTQAEAEAAASKKRHATQTYAPQPFNPNTADSATMVHCGLRPFQAHNVMRYRAAGGHWRNAEHFSKLYGLSPEDYQRIAPYLIFSESPAPTATGSERRRADSIHQHRTYPEKFSEGTVVDLNTADTTVLKRIPGIGSYYSRKICEYRERLGGFLDCNQVKEIEGLPDGIEKWFTVSATSPSRKIAINRATFKELVRHPYLNYDQVKSIVNYRQKFGTIHSFQELSLDTNFCATDFSRLSPYMDWRE